LYAFTGKYLLSVLTELHFPFVTYRRFTTASYWLLLRHFYVISGS